jgi:hypothetical protein
MPSRTARAAKVSRFDLTPRYLCHSDPAVALMLGISLQRFTQHDKSSNRKRWMSQGARAELHLHDLSFFVLEMVVDRMHEAVREFLHFAFDIAQLILAQRAGGFEFLRFVDRSAPV